jgi:hyperosmotically inducible protein
MNNFKIRQAVAAALTILALSAPAAADTTNISFVKLDANRDGALSRDEVRSLPNYGRAFDQADENRDNRLSPDEFIKAEAIHDRVQAAGFVDDSVITAKVKGSLLKEMKSLKISVETYRGQVLLSGFVDDEAQVRRAVQVASAIDGVKGVRNGLAVK